MMLNKGKEFRLLLGEKYSLSKDKLDAYQVFYDIVWKKLEEMLDREQEAIRMLEGCLKENPIVDPNAPDEYVWELLNSKPSQMKEQELYYTPTIEEFCIGFVWEAQEAAEEKWDKYVIDSGEAMVKFNWKKLVWHLDNNRVRIKYLDREDILSEGFKCMGGGWYHDQKAHQIIGNWESLEVSRGEHEFRDILFKGTVKNLSELKVILKQLGI